MKFASTTILILLLLTSCNKDKFEPEPIQENNEYIPLECILAGNSAPSNVHFTDYSTNMVLEYSYNDLLTHEIDINSDGVNDFQLNFYSNRPFAGTWYKGTVIKVKPLHMDAEISTDPLYEDSTYSYANRYFESDTLFQQSLWNTDESYISLNGDDLADSCNAPGCPMVSHGVWFGSGEQYIGIRMNGIYLGWIKISLPVTDPHFEPKLIIEEYACAS